ncbi:MAG TPA: hypothetical protein VFT66_25190 [Roseiflexaceae bacterium]|nr:hypothetical protein [Roseiflexaceae bacterium]
MPGQIGRPFTVLASWLGGWSRLVLLVVVVVGLGAGLLWEQNRHPLLPAGASQPNESIVGDLRQTTYRYQGSIADVRAFYRQTLPSQGWRYCGTQATEHCSNMIQLVDRPGDAVDVYRRADDQQNRGSTIEIWPVDTQNGQTYVTVFETRGR